MDLTTGTIGAFEANGGNGSGATGAGREMQK